MLLILTLGVLSISARTKQLVFSGDNALLFAKNQLDMGPRVPGSSAHQEFGNWATALFSKYGWQVEEQTGDMIGHPLMNIIAKKGLGKELVIIGAHYDSRMIADKDQPASLLPVPGANDGASGVAVIMELARVLDVPEEKQIWLVLFDLEDQGKINAEWDSILGSKYFVDHLDTTPQAVVVIDMIGDRNLEIKREQTSDQSIIDEIWSIAKEQGYKDQFQNIHGFSILDDHTPFLNNNIPAVDIIDFDYPFWHTSADTLDKISVESLHTVGSVLETWLER